MLFPWETKLLLCTGPSGSTAGLWHPREHPQCRFAVEPPVQDVIQPGETPSNVRLHPLCATAACKKSLPCLGELVISTKHPQVK